MSLRERQAELVATHHAVQEAGLPYVLVGGWAVSAFQTRFTTDVDMVLPEDSLAEYDALLGELGFEKQFDSDVSNIYEGRTIRYEKPVGENAVQFDALVNAMRCRQADAEWSFRYLHRKVKADAPRLDLGEEADTRGHKPCYESRPTPEYSSNSVTICET